MDFLSRITDMTNYKATLQNEIFGKVTQTCNVTQLDREVTQRNVTRQGKIKQHRKRFRFIYKQKPISSNQGETKAEFQLRLEEMFGIRIAE